MIRPLRFSFLTALSLFACNNVAAAERTVSFEELPKLIRERNENVQAAEAHYKASKERTGYLTRSFVPQLSASIGSEEFQSGSFPKERQGYWSVQGRLNLFRGGRDRIENEIRKFAERRTRAEYSIEVNKELKEARSVYWQLVAISKIIADRRDALEKNENYVRSSRRRTGAGIATNADTLQFELHKTLLNQDLKHLIHEEDILKSRLAVAIGSDDHENLKVNGDFQHPPENVVTPAFDSKKNLEVQQLESIQLSENLRKGLASRWWLPQLDLYSKYGVPSLDDEFATAVRQDREFTVGVMMTLDLGAGLENRYEGAARGFEALASEKRAAHRLREVRAADHELRHDMKLLHELIHDADSDIQKAEQFLKLTQAEYSRGVKNGPDLLEASKKLYEFRERRTTLFREYYEADATLTALTSKAD